MHCEGLRLMIPRVSPIFPLLNRQLITCHLLLGGAGSIVVACAPRCGRVAIAALQMIVVILMMSLVVVPVVIVSARGRGEGPAPTTLVVVMMPGWLCTIVVGGRMMAAIMAAVAPWFNSIAATLESVAMTSASVVLLLLLRRTIAFVIEHIVALTLQWRKDMTLRILKESMIERDVRKRLLDLPSLSTVCVHQALSHAAR